MLKEALQFNENIFPENSQDHRIFATQHGNSYGNVYEGNGMVNKKFEFWSVKLWNQALEQDDYSPKKYLRCRCLAMELIERKFSDDTTSTEIVISVLKPKNAYDDQPQIHNAYFTLDSQGQSLKNISSGFFRSEFRKEIRDQQIDGLLLVDQLPPQIDILATAQAFIDQVKAGNLATPQLIPPKSA